MLTPNQLQQNPVLVYNWFATFFEAEPARVDFNYVSIPADSKPYPAISYSVYEGNSEQSSHYCLTCRRANAVDRSGLT